MTASQERGRKDESEETGEKDIARNVALFKKR
jgi:hypothetical protein